MLIIRRVVTEFHIVGLDLKNTVTVRVKQIIDVHEVKDVGFSYTFYVAVACCVHSVRRWVRTPSVMNFIYLVENTDRCLG